MKKGRARIRLAQKSIPRLAALYPDFTGSELQMETSYGPVPEEDVKQMGFPPRSAASLTRLRSRFLIQT